MKDPETRKKVVSELRKAADCLDEILLILKKIQRKDLLLEKNVRDLCQSILFTQKSNYNKNNE